LEKLINLEDRSQEKITSLENDFFNKNRERLEFEAHNRLLDIDVKNELHNNQHLEYILISTAKLEELKQKEFENQISIVENMTKEKVKEYETIHNKMKEFDNKSTEDPLFKIEFEKNVNYKKKN